MAGVASEVRSSVDEFPVSEDAARSGAEGAEGALVSTVRASADPVVDWLPAASVTCAVTDQVPSVSPDRSHDDAAPTVYEHVFVVAPFVAVNNTVSPVVVPASARVGVVSDVTSSADDEPVSEAAARSGATGADGAVVSMTRLRAAPADDVFPAASVRVAVTDHVPSERVPRSHDVDGWVNEHDTDVPPFVVVTVVVSPAAPPATDTVGVLSEVLSSVLEDPESDADARSGAAGADGAVASTVIESAEPADDTLPAGSVSVADTDHVPSLRVGRSHDAAGTT